MKTGSAARVSTRLLRALFAAILPVSVLHAQPGASTDFFLDEGQRAPVEFSLDSQAEREAEAMARFITGMFEEESAGPEKALENYRRVLTLDPGFTRLAIDVAYDFLRRGESADAIGVLKDALKANPADPAPALALSSIYLRHLRKPDFATKYAEAAVKAAPESFGGYEALWEIGQAQNDQPLSLKALERASRSKSDNPGFWLSLAEFYATSTPGDAFLDGKIAKAIRASLDRAIETAGDDATNLARIADFYLIHLQHEPAADLYARAADLNSALPKIQEKLASSLIEIGRTDDAIPVLEQVIIKNPLDLASYELLRQLYVDREEYTKALACVQQAIIIDNRNIFLHDQLVRLLLVTGDYPGAAKSLAEARERFPQTPVFTQLHGRALSLVGRHEEAVQTFQQALIEASSAQPELLNGEFFLEYGFAAEQAGQYVKADELLRKAIELTPENPSIAYNALGYMWVERGEKLDEAEQLIRRALEIEPDNAAYVDSLGWLYFKKGRYEEALTELLKAARTIETPDAVIFDHVGDAYHALNRTAEAMLYWKKAAQLDPENETILSKIDNLTERVVQQPAAPDRPNDSVSAANPATPQTPVP